jgi:ubiquinone/menaquinone biosynthesis C-methylase UbiE
MEAVLAGPRLQRCRVTWIDALTGCDNILIVGVGHGHFLKKCVQRFPDVRITCVDASAGMLRCARRRAQRAGARMGQLTFVHAAVPAWTPPTGEFDAIVTHFFLDCFAPDELAVIVAALARAARPAARWLVSDFAMPPSGWARTRALAVHALMYGFFRHVTRIRARRLTQPDRLLETNGFTLARQKQSEWGLLRSDLWLRNSLPWRSGAPPSSIHAIDVPSGTANKSTER